MKRKLPFGLFLSWIYFRIRINILISAPTSEAFNFNGNIPQKTYKNLRAEIGALNSNSPKSAYSPFPNMPSQTFVTLVESQFELLSNCLVHDNADINRDSTGTAGAIATKVKSMALYLPQENQINGQLEFIPVVIYPSPQSERVFIANDAETGLPPTIPRILTKLPGFAHAQTLLPAYPFASRTSNNGNTGVSVCVGEVEEVMCEPTDCSNGSVLSVPLFHGSRTVGVLLTWPTTPPTSDYDINIDDESSTNPYSFPWTQSDADQIKRAAYSLGVALQMDEERTATQTQADHLRVALAENLHQVRNPLQALRTFGKLLQRKIALEEQIFDDQNLLQSTGNSTNNIVPAYMQYNRNDRHRNDRYANSAMILSLAENMMVQSERVADLLEPMDSLLLGNGDEYDEPHNDQEQLSDADNVMSFGRTDSTPSPTMFTNYFSNATVADSSLYTTDLQNKTESTAITFRERTSRDRTSTGPIIQSKSKEIANIVKTQKPNIGELDMEIAFFPDVILSILSAGEAVATEKGIQFRIQIDDDLPGASVNPKSVQEAISNIINNALKYVVLGKIYSDDVNQNNDPKVEIILTPNPQSCNAGVSIIIADNGPGIPMNQRENVFQRGCRGDEKIATQVDGNGIGLDVSLSLIARMGGKLEILDANELGSDQISKATKLNGAVFRVMLFRNPEL